MTPTPNKINEEVVRLEISHAQIIKMKTNKKAEKLIEPLTETTKNQLRKKKTREGCSSN